LAIFIAHLLGYKKDENLRLLTVVLMGLNLMLAVWLWWQFDPGLLKIHGNDGFQFIEHGVWVRSLNAEYFVGVDGISISMVLLTALVSFVGAIASYSVKVQLKGYFAMYCLLVTGMMGTFVALDLILFFLFWEVMLLPMYFLIGIWGGPRRQYAAIKFFIYTLIGSVLMLLAFIYFYLNADPTYLVDGHAITRSLSIPELARVSWVSKGHVILGMSAVKVLWVAMFVCFAVKIPMFPFHTWLPDAHVEAPTAISVILAGVLLKMGTYGILRFNFTLLPEATRWAATAMAVFGVINILYGAFCAMAQSDLKRLVAYSSVSHMGYCLLAMGALTPQGIEACLVQMFNHGLITSMMFTLVGVIYDRVHTREIDRFGGLAQEMPLYATMFSFAFMASLGLPGLSGFWGEVLTFIGAFPRFRLLTVLAALGVIVTAAYHLWALQRMFLGKFKESWRQSEFLKPFGGRFPEINRREMLSLAPLALLVLLLGFYPRPLLRLLDRGALQLHRVVDEPGPAQVSERARPPAMGELDTRLARANQVPTRADDLGND
jgi:NADH-quinone oxidoreductase subunit M